MSQLVIRRRFKTLLLLGAVAALAIALILTMWPVQATFEVTMESEALEVTNTSEFPLEWSFDEAELVASDGSRFTVHGSDLLIPPRAIATIQRISQGPLLIRVRSQVPRTDAIVVRQADVPSQGLGDRAVIIVGHLAENAALGRSTVLPVVGRVVLGRRVASRSQPATPISSGGVIFVKGHSLFTRRLYLASEHQLGVGDEVSFVPKATNAYGFVVANHNPGLTLSFRGLSSGVAVRRFASDGYLVRLPAWKRIVSDEVVLGAWLSFVFLFGGSVAVRKAFAGED